MKLIMKRSLLVTLVITLVLSISGTALADEVNPLTAINNLTEMLYTVIVAVGVIFLALGGFQFAMALKEQDPSRKSHAILSMVGGLILVGIRFVIQWILTGM